MSDYWKKFKSVFIVEEESKPAAARPKQPVEPSTPVGPAPAPDMPVSASPAGSVSDRFMDILMTALEKNNREGFDYLEYKQSLKNLASMAMDEATRYKSAFAMAQTLGVTRETLLESGQYYLSVLGQEEDKFNHAHTQQRQKLVGEREKELHDLKSGIAQREAQISQLQQEIEAAKQRMSQIDGEIHTNTQKIERTRADFEATLQVVRAQIQGDLERMQQYLPVPAA